MQLNPTPQQLTRNFWRYTIPAITAMLVTGLYVIVDGIFVGQYVGPSGLAAINLAWPLTYVLSGFGVLIGMGAGSLISMFRGELRQDQAQRALTTGLWLMLLLGVLGSSLLGICAELGLSLQGANQDTLPLAQEYLSVFVIAGILTVSANALPFLLRNDDSPQLATGLLVLGAVSNIALDYYFLAHLQWGLYGAALATIIAQGLITLFGLSYFFTRFAKVSLTVSQLCFDLPLSQRILVLGTSTLIMFLYASVMVAMHNAVFMHYSDTLTLGAFAVIGYLMSLYYMVSQGVAEGMQPQVSFYHGAQQPQIIARVFRLAATVTIIAGIVWTGLLNVFPELFIRSFNNSSDALVEIATQGIMLHLFAMTIDGLIALASVYFMSINQPHKAMFISIGNIAIQLPFLFVLPMLFGVSGIWLAMPLSTVLLFIPVCYWLKQSLQAER